MSEENKTIEMYYITAFKKFDRKIYQLFGKKIGRAIRLKSIVYGIATFVIMWILRHLPLINMIFLKIPFLVSYLLMPIISAYLLSDVESEQRTVLSYMRSVVKYQLRKFNGQNFYRGKSVKKPQKYKLGGYAHVNIDDGRKIKSHEGKRYKLKGFATYR